MNELRQKLDDALAEVQRLDENRFNANKATMQENEKYFVLKNRAELAESKLNRIRRILEER